MPKLTRSERMYIDRLERRLDGDEDLLDMINDAVYYVVSWPYRVKFPSLSERYFSRFAEGKEPDALDELYVILTDGVPGVIGFVHESVNGFFGNLYNKLCEKRYKTRAYKGD